MRNSIFVTLFSVCFVEVKAFRDATTGLNIEVCSLAVPGGRLYTKDVEARRKCKCPQYSFVLNVTATCPKVNLPYYYDPLLLLGKGCKCSSCSDVVSGARQRTSWYRRPELKCKCIRGASITGNNPECKSDSDRYFDPRKLVGKGCTCATLK